MSYKHPKPGYKLNKQGRAEIMADYRTFYTELARKDPSALNRKVPREVFADLHDQVGRILLEEATRLAGQAGPIQEFLSANPLPEKMKPYLPVDYRIFCLVLNSFKQWAVKEVAATD